MSLSKQLWSYLPRFFTLSLGACSIGWAVVAISSYRAEANFPDFAGRMLLGDTFNARQLALLKHRLDGAPTRSLRATALVDVAVIRQRLLDTKLTSHEAQSSDFVELDSAVTTALAEVPASSFLWLSKYWLESQRAAVSPDFEAKLLRMSYWSAPNDSWIAIKRNPLALKALSTLPADLGEQALEEFTGLLRSRLYHEAAGILGGSEPDVRRKLLSRLSGFSDVDRREFAKVIDLLGVDVVVPGVDRPSVRPY